MKTKKQTTTRPTKRVNEESSRASHGHVHDGSQDCCFVDGLDNRDSDRDARAEGSCGDSTCSQVDVRRTDLMYTECLDHTAVRSIRLLDHNLILSPR